MTLGPAILALDEFPMRRLFAWRPLGLHNQAINCQILGGAGRGNSLDVFARVASLQWLPLAPAEFILFARLIYSPERAADLPLSFIFLLVRSQWARAVRCLERRRVRRNELGAGHRVGRPRAAQTYTPSEI